MDGAELSRWWTRWRKIAPFGDEWRQTGQISAMIANTALARSEGAKPFEEDDFMPLYTTREEVEKREQTEAEQQEMARTVHGALMGH